MSLVLSATWAKGGVGKVFHDASGVLVFRYAVLTVSAVVVVTPGGNVEMYTRKTGVDGELVSESLLFEGIPFHAKGIASLYALLKTDYAGLTSGEVALRQAQWGENRIGTARKIAPRSLFLSQCRRLVFYVLFAAALVTLLMGQIPQGLIILGAWAVVNGLNFFAEWLGQKSLSRIGSLEASICRVRREGKAFDVPSSELVPGDILIFSCGMSVPADARLISAENVQVDESLVTGESTLVTKDARAILIPDQDLTEQTNMIFAGSRVKTGKGEAVVTAIGAQTMMGTISRLAEATEKRDALLSQGIGKLTQTLFWVACLATLLVGGSQLSQGMPAMPVVQMALVMLVASIPEMLVPLVTLLFSMGIRNLAQKSILVKSFHAIESVGSMTVLCTDKTGTLTENALTMQRIFLPELGDVEYNPMWKEAKSVPNAAIEMFLRIARMNNATVMDGIRSAFVGDPIDIALYRASSSVFERGFYCVRDVPFDQTTMRTATIVRGPEGKLYSFIKGAPESVLAVCQTIMRTEGGTLPLHNYDRNEFLLRNQELALEAALRVIGFAYKEMLDEHDDPYSCATFVAWACLVDPPKEGAQEGVKLCQQAGLRMVMITGDQKATAAVTAKKLGLLLPEGDIWTRKDLDSGVETIPANVCVFARTKPEEKLAIVASLQQGGDVVGMVGDGVNDMPALLKSDISIAMGLHGTDAAQECADIVLLNDRFDNIVEAVAESRHIICNILYSVQYMVSCNLSLLVLATALSALSLAGVFGYQDFPLTPVQMIWLNVVMVSLPTLTLALMPAGEDAGLRHQPTRPELLAGDQLLYPLVLGALMAGSGLVTFGASHLILHQTPAVTSTLTFFAMAGVQLLNLLSVHLRASGMNAGAFLKEIFQVPVISIVMAFSLMAQGALYYFEPLHAAFGLATVAPWLWLLPVGASVLMTLLSMGGSQTE